MKKIDLQNYSLHNNLFIIGIRCSELVTMNAPGLHILESPLDFNKVTFTGRVTLRIAQGGLRNKITCREALHQFTKKVFKEAWQQLCKTISVPPDSTGLLFLDYAEGKLKGAVFSPNIKN